MSPPSVDIKELQKKEQEELAAELPPQHLVTLGCINSSLHPRDDRNLAAADP